MDRRVIISGNQNIQHGIDTLGEQAGIQIRHSIILVTKMNEINDAKNSCKREAKKTHILARLAIFTQNEKCMAPGQGP